MKIWKPLVSLFGTRKLHFTKLWVSGTSTVMQKLIWFAFRILNRANILGSKRKSAHKFVPKMLCRGGIVFELQRVRTDIQQKFVESFSSSGSPEQAFIKQEPEGRICTCWPFNSRILESIMQLLQALLILHTNLTFAEWRFKNAHQWWSTMKSTTKSRNLYDRDVQENLKMKPTFSRVRWSQSDTKRYTYENKLFRTKICYQGLLSCVFSV